MRVRNGALLAVWMLIVGDACAVDRRWNNGTGSFVFGTAGNWQGGVMPGVLDVAQFGISVPLFPAGAYTVSFNNNATNQALHIEDDLVTFNLNSRVYAVTGATGLVVSNQSNSFSARLTVTNGTITSTTGSDIDVGAIANKIGTLNVTSGGRIPGSPDHNIGKLGTGALNVDLGGVISTTGSTTIGAGNGVAGTATILGNASPGSATLQTGALNVGSVGDGTINVQIGGLLQNSGIARLGTGSQFTGFGTGIVNVMNAGSVWNSLGVLEVGAGGTGEVNVSLGGTLNGADTTIGASASRGGEVNVDGLNSKWDNSGTLTIGGVGAGTLNITNQGVVETEDTIVGSVGLSTSTGTINVSGTDSRWTNASDLKIGFESSGTLNINSGGKVESLVASIGYQTSSVGVVTVDGAGSVWDLTGSVLVDVVGRGTLNITNGGKVQLGGRGEIQGPGSSINVNGVGSLWESGDRLNIGAPGDAILNITGGGQVHSATSGLAVIDTIGTFPSFTGRVVVDGTGSEWTSDTQIMVGRQGAGTLEITNGGTVTDGHGSIGVGTGITGHVTVSGPGSKWINPQSLTVGGEGDATLDITDEGHVSSGFTSFGALAGSEANVTIDGLGSYLFATAEIYVGNEGQATVNVSDGGGLFGNDDVFIGRKSGSQGNLTVGSTTNFTSVLSIVGKLGIEGDPVAGTPGGTAQLRIEHGGVVDVVGETVVFKGQSATQDALVLEGGRLSTPQIRFENGANSNFDFKWTSGTLAVGTFQGDLVNQAGTLAPAALSGNAEIQGNYNQLAAAALEIELGGITPGVHRDLLDVSGNVFLAGALELTLFDGFVPKPASGFVILFAGNEVFGEFDNAGEGERLMTTDGLGSFLVHYGTAFVTVSGFQLALPGDYNANGTVDAADYVLWRKGGPLANEVDNPGTVNAADYTAWRARFGNSGSGASTSANVAVPEPTTLLLSVLAVVGQYLRRDRNA